MQILDNLIILSLIVLSFISGMCLANKYHMMASQEQKEALEKQFLRLKARSDADDPCRPYGTPRWSRSIPQTGDFDGDFAIGYKTLKNKQPDLIDDSFMNELKTTGKAKTTFRKSDLAK